MALFLGTDVINKSYVSDCYDFKPSPDVLKSAKMACVNYNLSLK
jgi:hypothetical protein